MNLFLRKRRGDTVQIESIKTTVTVAEKPLETRLNKYPDLPRQRKKRHKSFNNSGSLATIVTLSTGCSHPTSFYSKSFLVYSTEL